MRERHTRPTSRPGVVVLLCALLVACSGAPATQPPAGASDALTPTQDPGTGSVALPTEQPISTGPLPEPVLMSADDIVNAIGDPAMAEQAVVSMLQLLGIGLYQPDGTPIRKGTERSDDDFYLFEPEAHGLANMLRQLEDVEKWMSFLDFHAALAGIGYERSAVELAGAYVDAYAADPDALIPQLVGALTTIEVEGQLPEFAVWLLILDGFVRPNAVATASAIANDPLDTSASARFQRGWGLARGGLAFQSGAASDPARMVLRLKGTVAQWRVTCSTDDPAVHEGHGGPGTSSNLRSEIDLGSMPLYYSPFNGKLMVPNWTRALQVTMLWAGNSVADAHGSLGATRTQADQDGEATNLYTPRQEPANGQGFEMEDVAVIACGFAAEEALHGFYGSWVEPFLAFFKGSLVSGTLHIGIAWHEVPEAVIKIVWTDTYNGVQDKITFLGNLTATEPNPLGGVMYVGSGTATGMRAGYHACNPGLGDAANGTVPATFNGVLTEDGSIVISAYADIFTALAGVSTAPMEVPIVGGFAQWKSDTVDGGELCPHTSHGQMTVTMLALP